MKTKILLFIFLSITINLAWSQGFTVVGNELRDANGNNFIMKGINIPLAWFVSDVNNNIANIKNKTGSNCFRIVVTTSTPDNAWQSCVQNCINNKIIPMVELHDATGNNSPAELNRMALFWASKSAYLTRPDISKYILINIANEWSDWFMSATATGTVSRVTWRDAYITAVKTIRNAGIKTTLVVDAAGYGQDNKAQTILNYAKAVQASDPLHNCLFSVHMYCEWAGNSSITTLLPAIKNAGIPIIVGEFGFQHSEGNSICDINESQIITTSNTNSIGWLAWSWKGNGSPVQYLDMSTDWAGNNLSAWGNTVVNGSGGTKTAINASVFTTTTNTPPTINLTAPSNNANFTAPATITITANATDANGTVTNVQFFNGTTLLATDATAPYSFSWTTVPAGTYSITAKATDNAGATITSTPVSVSVTTVTTNTPPTVNLTTPSNNANFTAPATITITANATDANGTVTNVQFFNGSTLLATDATAPYSFSWTTIPAGTYSLTAKATDNAGATTTSTPASVTVTAVVSNADLIGPDCGTNNTTITFELNTTKRANVTSYNWWYTGSAASTTSVTGFPYRVNIQTGANFSAGQVCVGTNLNVAPWHISYCKSIIKCAGARLSSEDIDSERVNETTISPNPSANTFTIAAVEEIQSYTLISNLGTLVMEGGSINSGQTISFGETLSAGLYTLKIHYKSGRTETKTIQKVL